MTIDAKQAATEALRNHQSPLIQLSTTIHSHPETAWQEYRALGLLRQQLPSTARVHGIMTHAGDAPNAVPERTEGRWYLRAETLAELGELTPRVERCFEAGALASGAKLTISPESKPYAEFRNDAPALAAYRKNALALGRLFDSGGPAGQMNRASTDMGNVSQIVPAIHPYIGIGSLPATNHQPEFAACCVGPRRRGRARRRRGRAGLDGHRSSRRMHPTVMIALMTGQRHSRHAAAAGSALAPAWATMAACPNLAAWPCDDAARGRPRSALPTGWQ